MTLLEKIGKKAKTGLIALTAGAILGIGGAAYAKQIEDKGWPLPDETQYFRLTDPSAREIPCEYEGKTLNVNIKIGPYVSMNNVLKSYMKYSFEDRAYMYVIMEPENGTIKMTILADRDGNGTLETKYDMAEDEEEFDKDGTIPQWILEEVARKIQAENS